MWQKQYRFSYIFSSRSRHQRCSRDWSSDVCSSDLRWKRQALLSARKRESIVARRHHRGVAPAEGPSYEGGREHLAYLELSEARYRSDLLDGLPSVGEPEHLPREMLGVGLAKKLLERGGWLQNGVERAELTQDPIAVLYSADAREE